jgi:hypothetical protein
LLSRKPVLTAKRTHQDRTRRRLRLRHAGRSPVLRVVGVVHVGQRSWASMCRTAYRLRSECDPANRKRLRGAGAM